MNDKEPVVIVPVPLPRSIYRILAKQAEDSGTHVGPLIARGLIRALRPRPKLRRARSTLTPELEALLRDRHAANVTDSAIARELDVAQPTVSRWRRSLNLPPVTRSAS